MVKKHRLARAAFVPCALLALTVIDRVVAQTEFENFESAPIDPMTVVRIDDRDYLVVCNTPDNSVEVYDTTDMAFVGRVPTGLRPVTVRYNPILGRLYTANFLGDSVTQIRMRSNGPGQPPLLRLERTTHVGDEPTDIHFLPDGWTFWVTLNSRGAMGWYDSVFHFEYAPPVGRTIELTMPMLSPTASLAVKEPRRIALSGASFVVLGHKGGNGPNYDFDLLVWNLGTGYHAALGGLGTTNFNFEFGVDGKLYVVGLSARNRVVGEDALRQSPTGFARSELYSVDGWDTPTPVVARRDLNRDATLQVVPRTDALGYPTDVALFENGVDVVKVFVAAMGSDRIGILRNPLDGSTVDTWPTGHVDVPNERAGYGRSGPRGLLVKRPAPDPADPGSRLYALNWLNQSIAVIDPVTEVLVQTVPLQNDPQPEVVRKGREFLYSTDLSGHGFASCAGCHIDGRTDFLTWDLGDPTGGDGAPVPPELQDGIGTDFFNENKGPLVTQSLQAMLQAPVEGFARTLFTNAPYHWRGDKADLTEFNEAFVKLMGMPNLGTPDNPRGLDTDDMAALEAMLETIRHPPNPDQNLDRMPSGTFGDAADESTGSGAARGLKLYLSRAAVEGRSCVQCHALPPGTNRRLVQIDPTPTFESGQPLEAPNLIGLPQRESLLESVNLLPNTARTGDFGMLRRGVARTSIERVVSAFAVTHPGQDHRDVAAFLHEYDWGIAPAVGFAITIDTITRNSPTALARVGLLEQQVERGNVGLVADLRGHGAVGTNGRYYYDVSGTAPGYRKPDGTTATRAALLGQLTRNGDRVIFQVTEPGMELRVVTTDGSRHVLTGPAPSQVTLEPMSVAAHWLDVARIDKNWTPGTGPNDFNFLARYPDGSPMPHPIFLKAQRVYQQALIDNAPELGVTTQGHDAPRRLRVAAMDLRIGARLLLHVPVEAPPPVNADPQTEILELPLAPTTATTTAGVPIWVTTVEVPQFVTLTLLCGGPFAPGVNDAKLGNVPEPPPPGTFEIATWNRYRVDVQNADGAAASGGWQTLTIE